MKKKQQESKPQVTNSQRNKYQYISVAKLKLQVKHPEVVEYHDVNSKEPQLLNELKGMKNTVPVPEHWSRKKQYRTKRTERELYKLPEYIEQTGIGELRQSYLEKEEDMKLKQKIREKVRPKTVGCIDYEILYNAFFNNPNLKKEQLTSYGELYHDEQSPQVTGIPFHLSDRLRNALGIGKDENPPWKETMDKLGLPPSYKSIVSSFQN